MGLLHRRERDEVVRGWNERLDRIEDDVQELLTRRYIFRRLQEIVEANVRLHRPSHLYPYLVSTYASSAVAGVRRHTRNDRPARDGSLIGLLTDIRDNSNLLTRARHIGLYEVAGMPPDMAARSGSAAFDELASPEATHLERRHVQPDITSLRRSASTIEHYATRRIAHLDLRGPDRIPTFPELDAALDELGRIVRRYVFLIRGYDTDVVPTLDGGWEAVLMEPWIPAGP